MAATRQQFYGFPVSRFATTVARVTGFTEYPAGSGRYERAGNTAPAVTGTYTLFYDDDGGTGAVGHNASEELVVQSNPQAGLTPTYVQTGPRKVYP